MRHLEAACEQTERLGAGPFHAECRLALGRVFTDGEGRDEERARTELEQAREIAIRLGMAPLAGQTETLIASL